MVLSMLPMNVFGNVNLGGNFATNSFIRQHSDFESKLYLAATPGWWDQGQFRGPVSAREMGLQLTGYQTFATANGTQLTLALTLAEGGWASLGGGLEAAEWQYEDNLVYLQWGDSWKFDQNVKGASYGQIPGREADWHDRSPDRVGLILNSNRNVTTGSALAGFSYNFEAYNKTQGTLRITFPSNINDLDPTDVFALIKGIYVQPDGTNPVQIDIRANNFSGPVIESFAVFSDATQMFYDLSLSVANPTAGENYLYFNELRITENRRGALTHGDAGTGVDATHAVITLFAPDNYKWVTPSNGQAIEGDDDDTHRDRQRFGWFSRLKSVRLMVRRDGASVGAGYMLSNHNNSERRYLSIVLPLEGLNNMNSPAERLSLRGIGLVAENRADFGSVNVKYAIDWVTGGRWLDGWSGVGNTGEFFEGIHHNPNNTPRNTRYTATRVNSSLMMASWTDSLAANPDVLHTVWTPPSINFRNWMWKDLDAGTRSWTEAEFALRPGDDAPTLRAGDQGHLTYDDTNGAWTAWVRLQENAIGAWGAGLGMDVTFRPGPEDAGLVIIGAQVQMPDMNYPYNASDAVYYNLSRDDELWNTNLGSPDRETLGLWNHPDARGVLVTPNYVRVTPGLQNWHERATTRHIDVRLQLSIEPGYWHKYGDVIEITVDGPSTVHVIDKTVVAAHVMDPITVEVEPADITIVDNTAYNVAVREINDIIITEDNFGMLRQGDDIWVYVIGARANEVEFTTDPVAEVNTDESGLKLSRGSVLRHRWSNSWVNGMRFTVEERSHDRAGRVPGEIVITGGKITGPVYPGVEYQVVVSGEAVAANDYTVWENRRAGNTLQEYDRARLRGWRFFDENPPYAVPAFEYDVEGSAPPPDDSPAVAPPATVSQSLTLNEWSPEINGVKPFVMVPVDGNTRVGMVSPRVIAEFFGGEAQWDAGSGTATISGIHKDGHAVEVTLQAGATSGTINGASQDIATYSGSAAPGLVSVYTSDSNNFYVPMRFMTNAFGYTIDWNPLTATATIRN